MFNALSGTLKIAKMQKMHLYFEAFSGHANVFLL
jgi:hypothetical protein